MILDEIADLRRRVDMCSGNKPVSKEMKRIIFHLRHNYIFKYILAFSTNYISCIFVLNVVIFYYISVLNMVMS